ncbi:MAG: 2-dehydropantoate 2-reductase N-terminal domain-containing protein [Polyangiales bacterium]
MRIAVVGAGALGCTYALKLSQVAQVVLVVRDLAHAPERIVAERANGNGPTIEGEAPRAFTAIPDDVDAVLVAVRVDQLEDALLDSLASGGPPHRIVVMLTPLLPAVYERVAAKLGDRLVVAMPGVVAYEPDHVASSPPSRQRRIRYWTPKASPTQLDARVPDERSPIIADLAQTLVAAGLPAEVKAGVRTTNPATTIAFFPLLLGIQAAGGSIARLLDDGALLRLSLDAAKETRALAKTVGELAGFAGLLLSFAGPFTIRAGMKLVRSRAPESLVFLEKHFGGKLAGQNVTMLRAIDALAHERGMSIAALQRLAEHARQAP